MSKLINNKFLLCALMLHVSLFIFLELYCNIYTTPKKIGNVHAQLLAAFIYQGNYKKSLAHLDKEHSLANKKLNVIENKIPLNKAATHVPKKERNGSKPVANQSKLTKEIALPENSLNRGESRLKLIALLHDAIQEKQTYPANALEMQRQGRVIVTFTLFEDGHIADLKVTLTSGTSSLDAAALSAVAHAAPFDLGGFNVDKPQEYQIDIVFE